MGRGAASQPARALQRRLSAEEATFQRVLEETRRELARHYRMHSSLELNETAYLLGYEDANSFFRAFHHWERTSPGEWKAMHRKEPAARMEEGIDRR
jgi:AraC-like DNA-binding protein